MPSKAILEQKQQVVSDLSELIRNSASGVIVNYQGITVDDDTKMRKALREAGVKYMVVKNTLTGRACDECGYSEIKQHLTGMTAIAISEKDAVAPAKILKEYADKIESFKILAGYVDGEVLDEKNVLALAEIPSRRKAARQSAQPALQTRFRSRRRCKERVRERGSTRGGRSCGSRYRRGLICPCGI